MLSDNDIELLTMTRAYLLIESPLSLVDALQACLSAFCMQAVRATSVQPPLATEYLVLLQGLVRDSMESDEVPPATAPFWTLAISALHELRLSILRSEHPQQAWLDATTLLEELADTLRYPAWPQHFVPPQQRRG